MKTRKKRLGLLASAVVALLAGCGGNGGGGGDAGATRFDDFVIDIVQNGTFDTIDPVELNGQSFSFNEDPAAFDVLFR